MSLPSKSKTVGKVIGSMAFLFILVAIAIAADDRSLVGLCIVFAAVLGVPFLLLSLIDLGKVKKNEGGSNYRATRATWVLSQLQAAFGAICVAAAGYGVYHTLVSWLSGSTNYPVVLLFVWVISGVMLAIIGIHYIYSAFAQPRKDVSNGDDV